jgi:hypothetical protein
MKSPKIRLKLKMFAEKLTEEEVVFQIWPPTEAQAEQKRNSVENCKL